MAHLQSNGQVERANGLILKGIKPRLLRELKEEAGAWVDELPSLLWGLRTTPNFSTRSTPLFLVYGSEAVLPSDLKHNAPRVSQYTEEEVEAARQDGVDLLEEERNLALSHSAFCQQDLCRYHDRHVRARSFQEGDMVLRVKQTSNHKLALSWEGPFVISRVLHNGAYRLYDVTNDIEQPHACNAQLLCWFYA